MQEDALARAHREPRVLEKIAILVEAWRERRLERTAELVLALDRHRSPTVRPASSSETQAIWLGRARDAASDPGPRGELLADIVTTRREWSASRIAHLAGWTDDPRIVPALLGLVPERVFSSHPCRPFWTAVFREVERRLDRTTAAVAARVAPKGITTFDRYLADKLRAISRAAARTPPLPEPTAAEVTLLDAIGASVQASDATVDQRMREELLAAVWAAPSDDGPREVYADWLMERGDPHGEFIALQLARARRRVGPTPRENELLEAHIRRWLGPLDVAVRIGSARFERGFLEFCRVAWQKLAATPGLMTHPAWATVRVYELESAGEEACDAWLDHMIALGAKRR